jgi:hypothetical protein
MGAPADPPPAAENVTVHSPQPPAKSQSQPEPAGVRPE